jgi:histone H3/H4
LVHKIKEIKKTKRQSDHEIDKIAIDWLVKRIIKKSREIKKSKEIIFFLV